MDVRYFTSYSGVRLPLKLIGPLEDGEIRNRNTYIRATFDTDGRLAKVEKALYGDITLTHSYAYHANGVLARAEIDIPDEDEDPTVLAFDDQGQRV